MSRTYIDTERHVEQQPKNDDRSKATGQLLNAEWLQNKQQDENCTTDTDNCRATNAVVDYLQALDSSKHRLCGCKNTVCDDQTDTEDGQDLQYRVCNLALLKPSSDATTLSIELGIGVSFHLDSVICSWVSFHDIALYKGLGHIIGLSLLGMNLQSVITKYLVSVLVIEQYIERKAVAYIWQMCLLLLHRRRLGRLEHT